MSKTPNEPRFTPCLCNALRKASRSVSRFYDEELRAVGLRTTQFSLLRLLSRIGPVRQLDMSELAALEETTLTRNLRPLTAAGWVSIQPGEDRREKLVSITAEGAKKLKESAPAWERAQSRMRSLLPEGAWDNLLTVLPEVEGLAAAG
jgi:DNA-binding MarR family transcriptional regulator